MHTNKIGNFENESKLIENLVQNEKDQNENKMGQKLNQIPANSHDLIKEEKINDFLLSKDGKNSLLSIIEGEKSYHSIIVDKIKSNEEKFEKTNKIESLKLKSVSKNKKDISSNKNSQDLQDFEFIYLKHEKNLNKLQKSNNDLENYVASDQRRLSNHKKGLVLRNINFIKNKINKEID